MSPASSATPNLDSTYSSAFLLALSTEAGSPCAVSKSTYLCKVIHCEEDIVLKLFCNQFIPLEESLHLLRLKVERDCPLEDISGCVDLKI